MDNIFICFGNPNPCLLRFRNLTIHKCAVNVIPFTNPTQSTKLAKQIVKTEFRLFGGILISRILAIMHRTSPLYANHTCPCY